MRGPGERAPSLAEEFPHALGLFRPGWMLLPLVITVGAGAVMVMGSWRPGRAPLEIAAIQVLTVITALCVLRFAISRRPFFLWGASLCGVLLSREIHFAGTSTGVYFGVLILFVLALHHMERLIEYMQSRFVINALAIGFCLYAISVTIDARWWKPRGLLPGIPGEEIFHVPLEETMELLGHLMIGLGLLGARRAVGSRSNSSPGQPWGRAVRSHDSPGLFARVGSESPAVAQFPAIVALATRREWRDEGRDLPAPSRPRIPEADIRGLVIQTPSSSNASGPSPASGA